MAVIPKTLIQIPSDENHIAVGLSGGGDSMALAHYMCVWAQGQEAHIHLLTVNHNLRPEAMAEAEQIGEWVNEFPNATHHILTWDFDDKPNTAVMERARNARYELMTQYCKTHGIKTLCIAHHGDDQIETFFFRLAKGSGLDGLTGMKLWSDYNDNLKIYRPFLSLPHVDLIQYCQDNNLQWIEDPSNNDEKYARPRLRKTLQNEGFEVDRFSKTLQRLSRAQEALDWMVLQAEKQCMSGNIISYGKLKTQPIDIQIRILQKSIVAIGTVTHSYPPKLERIETILDTLKPKQSATLHGCVLSLSKDGNSLEIKGS